jgi:hypothetical protein
MSETFKPVGVVWQVSSFSAITWQDEVTFWWDGHDSCFVLEQKKRLGTWNGNDFTLM